MYWYILPHTNVKFVYCHVPSCTGMYQYVLVNTNFKLPDPVQGYRDRIQDACRQVPFLLFPHHFASRRVLAHWQAGPGRLRR